MAMCALGLYGVASSSTMRSSTPSWEIMSRVCAGKKGSGRNGGGRELIRGLPHFVGGERRLRVTTTGARIVSCDDGVSEDSVGTGGTRSGSGWTVDIACLYTS